MNVKKATGLERERKRIHNSVVERMTVVRGTNMISPVSSVEPVKNDTFVSYNFLTASDDFYDKLKNLKKEYREFYHDQQELEKAIKRLEYDECLIENMGLLIEKYNLAIDSLKLFDYDFGTSYHFKIVHIIESFKVELFRIGIIKDSNSKLIYDKEKFKQKLVSSEDAFEFIFEPAKGLIIRLYKAFKNIKIPRFIEDLNEKYSESLSSEGLILDEKA